MGLGGNNCNLLFMNMGTSNANISQTNTIEKG